MSHLSARVLRTVAAAGLAFTFVSADASAAAPSSAQRADQALVAAAHRLDSCVVAHRHCATDRAALQVAGRHLDAVAPYGASAARASAARRTPVVALRNGRLSWPAAAGTRTYIVAARTAGHVRRSYRVVHATSTGVAAHGGRSVTYNVRIATVGSQWSAAKRVRVGVVVATSSRKKPPTTTTTTPPATTTTTTTTTTAPAPAPAPVVSGAPHIGIVVGSAIAWQLSFAQKLGAHSARMEFPIGTPVSTIAPIVDAYAQAGIRANLLAGFAGRIPSASDISTLASWGAAFGPGGTFWQGKSYSPTLAVDRIEFGNESSGPWQYSSLNGVSDWPNSPIYASIAQNYALAFKSASIALRNANAGVRLLAVADVAGREPAWMNNMFSAVPDLGNYVGGWTVHPYGPQWAYNVDNAMAQASSHGASNAIPMYITEIGVSTDDGNCLNNNYGWNLCMTYAQAADTMTTTVNQVLARYAGRLKEVDLYSASDICTHGTTNDAECFFGALTSTSGTKGAYTTAVQSLLAATG